MAYRPASQDLGVSRYYSIWNNKELRSLFHELHHNCTPKTCSLSGSQNSATLKTFRKRKMCSKIYYPAVCTFTPPKGWETRRAGVEVLGVEMVDGGRKRFPAIGMPRLGKVTALDILGVLIERMGRTSCWTRCSNF